MCTTSSNQSSVKRVLVAVDDSAPSRWAVQTGVEFAQALGARVLLLHVVVPQMLVMDIPITAEELDGEARLRGAELLGRMRTLVPEGIACDCMQLEGDPSHEIVAAAENSGVGLIVMGTRGAGRLSHFLLGSTADGVIRRAHCPVATVGHEPPAATKKPCCGKCANAKTAEQTVSGSVTAPAP
jgi:nucleotide-binding universal stress UspA family protein